MNILLFGSSTNVAAAFSSMCSEYLPSCNLISFSRTNHNLLDFQKPYNIFSGFSFEECIFVSFSPIWDFCEFLNYLSKEHNDDFQAVKAIYVCSSSSAISKRFSFSRFDKNLASKLINSEDLIKKICNESSIICHIFRPSMIYGCINNFKDKNISKLRTLMRFTPILLLPRNSGLRQPIYAGRLAEVFLFFIKKDLHSKFMNLTKSTIEVGGDKTINYKQIIISIKNSSSFLDLAKYVLIITVPNRVFYFLFSPVIIFSPKLYEAILRISSDLSGYIKSKDILNKNFTKSFLEEDD